MDITLTVDVTVEHEDGTPRTNKDEIIAMLVEHVQTGAPQVLTADNGARYAVTVWDTEEA